MATIKQKKAVKKIVENRGNISKGMRDAGYSPKTAKNPKALTDSKGWQELMEEYLPDKDLAKKHQELLRKQEIIVRNNNKTGKIEVIKTGELDTQAVGKGLEMAYKLKGKYAPTKVKFIDEYEGYTEEEIKEEIARRRRLGEFGEKSDNKGKKKSS